MGRFASSFFFGCLFVWAGVVWAGLEGVSRTEAAAGWPCAVVWGWLVVVLCGVGNTPACGGLLRLLWSWWSVVVGAPGACWCACWGWHAVGVLGQCALVAWPAFSASLFVGGVGVGVGGLVVNCIVDASILL